MPPWVPASERSKVGERIEGWARLLLSTGVDLSAVARDLTERPLLPVWIARRGGGGEKRGGGGGGGGGEEATGGRMDFEVIHARGGEGEEARAVATATMLRTRRGRIRAWPGPSPSTTSGAAPPL